MWNQDADTTMWMALDKARMIKYPIPFEDVYRGGER
jgi:hypothetical protein